MTERPPKWSRELLEWRRRQHMLARQKNYAEAQKIKIIADKLENKEKAALEQSTASLFARKEAQFRQQQQAELQALLKRIDARRKEHIKQRNLDSKRLMQRNRNVQAVLESKQAVESNRIFADIRKNLYQVGQFGRFRVRARSLPTTSHSLSLCLFLFATCLSARPLALHSLSPLLAPLGLPRTPDRPGSARCLLESIVRAFPPQLTIRLVHISCMAYRLLTRRPHRLLRVRRRVRRRRAKMWRWSHR